VTLLLFVGRLAPNKRVPLLVQALAKLQDVQPPVHLAVLGDTNDLYQAEAERCRQIAEEQGVRERLHFLGHVDDMQLLDVYRSADIFVMPSLHEGFCIPVLEAMACGLPVIAARTTALPETVGPAGITFTPEDVDDLVEQIRRALPARSAATARLSAMRSKVAVVAFRYGPGFAGGAEASLRKIVNTLSAAGHHVEVFTTCTDSESDWDNHLPEGNVTIDGIAVHRFRLDAHDRNKHLATVRTILENEGNVAADMENAYLRHSIHSTRLIEYLQSCIDDFDAVLTGPYLFGLTYQAAQAFAEKTILVPCFHDEPYARLKIWQQTYGRVGAILYHSRQEKALAESELGLNHPAAVCMGTVLDAGTRGEPKRVATVSALRRPYVVYCGRYSIQKNFPTYLEYARRYAAEHPERFAFVFLGEGEIAVPREAWAHDLGFVDEQTKRDVLAGAAALVQLSQLESLSLVALEAWAQAAPVIAHKRCAVLAAHLHTCGGGTAIGDFPSFTAALDDLWARPELWRAMGQHGQRYVHEQYTNKEAFLLALEETMCALRVPLHEHMRRQGFLRAAEHERSVWRERFGLLIEELLDSNRPPPVERIDVQPRVSDLAVPVGQATLLIPVRLANGGTQPIVHEGPAARVLRAILLDASGKPLAASQDTPLPGLVLPGQQIAAIARAPVPATPGVYGLALSAAPLALCQTEKTYPPTGASGFIQLTVTPSRVQNTQPAILGIEQPTAGGCAPSLEAVQAALAEAANKQSLPDDYADITEGRFAPLKRRIKRKLLGNFKNAYVDVLSRQQSAFNQHILAAMAELAECCAMLDHAAGTSVSTPAQTDLASKTGQAFLAGCIEKLVADGKADELAALFKSLHEVSAASAARLAALEARLTRLEACAFPKEQTTP
jgi:glycosyltransferase involved in cell wall biosynthesis